jgi:hypothetical protein
MYRVFGCKSDLLVESNVSTLKEAVRAAVLNSDNGFKARIWDVRGKRFIRWN